VRHLRYILLGLIGLLSFSAYSQLTTNSSQSPYNLVQNVLLGPGVTVSNIMYNGSPAAIGSFTATGTNLGINQGIVMTTGTVAPNGSGPQGPNNQPGCGMDNGGGGSSMLTAIIGGTQTFNASILEFDFIPYSDTVKFKYVFGSDEYPEFAPPNNSGYNDVFGFFISGPGITGQQNIARLPTNGSIVSINNVNAITNSQFYNFNGDGNSAPYNGSPYYIQYDGFTDVLEAKSHVQCGQTYHLIMAVADVGDGQWDSGIFLEANSLSSVTPISVDYQLSNQIFSNPDWMAEGCTSTTVKVHRANNLGSSLTIPLQLSGTATNGVDYSTLPSSITFNPGDTLVTLTFDALIDHLTEGLETVKLTFLVTDPCGNVNQMPVLVYIQDVDDLNITLNDPSVPCPGQDVSLVAAVTGGVPPYTYSWVTGETASYISVSPNSAGYFSVTVNDACLNIPLTDSVYVDVPNYQPIQLNASADITVVCPNTPQILYANATGGSGNYSYTWLAGTTIVGFDDSLIVSPLSTTTYYVHVKDNCGSIDVDTVVYTITSPPLVVTVSPEVQICPGDSTLISVSASGGMGNFTYLWAHNGSTTTSVWVHPAQSSFYFVQVMDDCQSYNVSGTVHVVVVKPIVDFIVASTAIIEDLPISFQNLTQDGYQYEWYFGDGGYSDLMHPSHVYDTAGTYYVTLIGTDVKGCTDSITKQIVIKNELYIYIPNAFFPDGDRFNEFFLGSFIGVKSIKMSIYNRWGERIYYTEDQHFKWDGTYDGKRVQDDTYTWKLIYVPNRDVEKLMTGHVTVLH